MNMFNTKCICYVPFNDCYHLLMFGHFYLQVSRPLRWVPSCLAVWAMATGILFTFTTTTRWVYASVCSWVLDHLDFQSHFWSSVLCLRCLFDELCFEVFTFYLWLFVQYFWYVGILVSQSAEHFELSWRVCAWRDVGVCLSPFHSCIFTVHLL